MYQIRGREASPIYQLAGREALVLYQLRGRAAPPIFPLQKINVKKIQNGNRFKEYTETFSGAEQIWILLAINSSFELSGSKLKHSEL